MADSIITKNGVKIDEGILDNMIRYFADPDTESDMFSMAFESIIDDEQFEFVLDNDVYLIKMNAWHR